MAPIQLAADQGLQDFYDLTPSRRLGRGRHAVVVECRSRNDRLYAMKLFKEDGRDRIAREIEILQYLRSGPNIIQIIDIVQGEEGANIGIVLEYIENIDYRTLYPRFTDSDIRYYTKELLKALEYAHGLGVMHRDVRPLNVVIDHHNRKLRLIGWSSAEFYQPGGEYDCCVGLNKPPEILLSHERYDCSVDMWCLGNMLASMIFRKDPFFHGSCLLDQLVEISKILGTERLYGLAEQLDILMEQEYCEALGNQEEKPWINFVDSGNEHLATMEGIDLVDRLLRFDPRERITAREALEHSYCRSLA
ncbi:cmgc ck2 kinase [Fusarium sporotrichioides]|uniref:EKC/KEOPS complex subunit BUD32 n=1 Tax=Fusarium sporotrichioides TaxID=5514 RepID=A0A395S6P4_FUSSP|nr:cmgc ck2 kinase [Fusarium sporotrichioides]